MLNLMDCVQEIKLIKSQHPSLYNFNHHHEYHTDFKICTEVEIPVKFCSIYKTFSDFESICMPRSCIDDMIREILGAEHISFDRIECRNVDNPNWFFGFLCLFFITILTFTIIGTVFDFKGTKKILQHTNKPTRIFLKISSAFSIPDNLKTLFNTKSSASSIDCLNGIKALSMPFIVFRHVFHLVTVYEKVLRNHEFETLNNNLIHITAILPTDTFFFVSGILCAKFFIQRKSLFSRFFQNIFQRYMRLTPSGIVVMAVFIAIKFHLMPTHPNYFYDPEIENCKAFWWTSVLHIQNYWNPNKMCFGSFWFATVIFQLFLVTPLIIYALKYVSLFVGIILIVPVLMFTQLPAFIMMMWNRSILGTIVGFFYTETLTRSYPYLVGLFYFWITTKTSKLELTKFISSNPNNILVKVTKMFEFFSRKLLWIATALIMASQFILFNNRTLSHDELNIYYLIIRIFWPFALCWIVHACHNGFGGFVDKILSTKIFFPLSSISLGIYLLNDHTALYLTEWLLNSPVGFNWNDIFYIFILTYIVCAVSSALLFLLVEVPFHRLSQGKYLST